MHSLHLSSAPRFVPRVEELEAREVPATLAAGFAESAFASGLAQPTAMEFASDGRLFVTQKGGQVRVVQDGNLLPAPFLSVAVDTFSERGLNGITFDPNFAQNGFVYVYYTTAGGTPVNRLSRFTADPNNPNVALAGSETVLLDNILATAGNHNGGALHFGADGKLYVGVGDAGTSTNAQTLTNLNGKLLRINSDGSVPSDNPFVGTPGARDAIWALGFRNPFTFAVQPSTGRIFVNDVGGTQFEEVNDLLRGGNYGWPICEGVCGMPGFIDPVHAYPRGAGAAITGGVFYEAGQFPAAFQGNYFFGDFVQGFIRRLTPGTLQSVSFASNVPAPVDLDVGPDGSLYYLSLTTGTVFQVRSVQPAAGAGVIAVGVNAGAGPHVRVLDAATRGVLFSFFAYDPGFQGGVRVAVGDINGDDFADVITGAGPGAPGGHVKVFDGRTGAEIRSFFAFPGFTGGVFVAAGDTNDDGFDDIIVSVDAGAGPHVKVFSGSDTALLQSFFAYDAGFAGGVRVAAGDLNGDGAAEVITGAGRGGPPHVRAFDGLTLGLRASFFAYDPGFPGGVWVAAGNTDGDGLAEIITGTDAGAGPHVKVFDAGGGERASFFAYGATFGGGVRVGATDTDGDGIAEIVTATGPGAGPHVKLFRAATLAELDSFFAFDPLFGGGLFPAGV